MEQAAHRKASGSTSNQPTDMRQTAHVPGQQRPDGQLDNKNLMDPHFVQHPMYPGIPDLRRPPSQNQSAFTPPLSGTDISQGKALIAYDICVPYGVLVCVDLIVWLLSTFPYMLTVLGTCSH